jgi:hypothetical protein
MAEQAIKSMETQIEGMLLEIETLASNQASAKRILENIWKGPKPFTEQVQEAEAWYKREVAEAVVRSEYLEGVVHALAMRIANTREHEGIK